MKFYDESRSLYIETDASGDGLEVALLQTRRSASCPRDEAPDNSILRPIAFVSGSLLCAVKRYSNREKEALTRYTIWTERFHHYFIAREVSKFTDHKTLVTIFKKDVATPSQRLQ